MKQRVGSLRKINNANKTLSKSTKRRRENCQIIKIISEKGDITTDTEEIQSIMKTHLKISYSTKLENVKEMNTLSNTHYLPKLNIYQISK